MSQCFLKCEQIGSSVGSISRDIGKLSLGKKHFGKGEGLWKAIGPTADTHKVPRDWKTTPGNSRIQSGASPDQFGFADLGKWRILTNPRLWKEPCFHQSPSRRFVEYRCYISGKRRRFFFSLPEPLFQNIGPCKKKKTFENRTRPFASWRAKEFSKRSAVLKLK